MVDSFAGKVCFITGGGAGLGRAFASALFERGASVVVADINPDAAQETVSELDDGGSGRALAVRCDVRNEDEVAGVVERAVDTFGHINILINSAGLHLTHYNRPFGELARDDFRDLLNVNVVGVVNCAIACQATMAATGEGIIVNLASFAGHSSISPYGVSKLAVRGLTIALARELAPDNIRVNCISPGFTMTPSVTADFSESFREGVLTSQYIKRFGRPEDIVATMLFLCSPDGGSFMTGETIRVCGGRPHQI